MKIWPKYLWSNTNTKKKLSFVERYLYCHCFLGRYIHCVYHIEPNHHISYLANYASSTIIFFITALVTQWFCQIVALPWWTWLLLSPEVFLHWQPHLVISSLLFLFLPEQIYECSIHWDICAFLGNCSQEFSKLFSKFLLDTMGNSCCKKDYSKAAVNVVEIIQIRLQKIKTNECSYDKF